MWAVAAIVSYDLCLKESSMKTKDQFFYIYNAYHGNTDRNIVPQVEMLIEGKNIYKYLYNKVPTNIVTSRNTRSYDNEEVDNCGKILELYLTYSLGERYVLGEYFTMLMMLAPTKARITEKVTGRYIVDVALNFDIQS